jgi:glutamate/tyrosine decarboxylase-like PLP-dependent enzyme
MDECYLDNNATTMPAPQIVEAMVACLREGYGNPSSVHRFGQHARQMLEEARGQVAQLVGCSEAELLFTGGGTESINTAIRGLLAARAHPGRRSSSAPSSTRPPASCARRWRRRGSRSSRSKSTRTAVSTSTNWPPACPTTSRWYR